MRNLVKWSGTTACLLAILMMTGGHWFVLQSVAWVSMLIDHSQIESLQVAISKTFDGQHPCPMCHAVEQGRQQEQQENKPLPGLRLDHAPELFLDSVSSFLSFLPLEMCGSITFVNPFYDGLLAPPPTPPPRIG